MKRNTALVYICLVLAIFATAACTRTVDLSRSPVDVDQGTASPEPVNSTPPLVGNDSDEHGCKPSAGYTWCEEKGRCIRSWEEPCDTSAPSDGKKVVFDCADPRPEICTKEYNPVCGQLVLNTGAVVQQTYGNKCEACAALKVISYTQGECGTDEQAPVPPPAGSTMPAFNGSGPQTTLTPCTDPRPQACTMEYNPVCGQVDNGIRCIKAPCPSTDAKTYSNGCVACSDQKVFGYTVGSCEDQARS